MLIEHSDTLLKYPRATNDAMLTTNRGSSSTQLPGSAVNVENCPISQDDVVDILDPLQDSRWNRLIELHPQSSIFHTTGWLEALHRTYGYRPVALSSSLDGPLENALVFCAIDSWITGRRWVSLPFSDHCQPLTTQDGDGREFLSLLPRLLEREKLKYLETRLVQDVELNGGTPPKSLLRSGITYCLHRLSLAPELNTIFRGCHKNSTQRKIRRAEREALGYEEGSSAGLLDAFFGLQVLTRRRHGLPPQPKQWFRNILLCLGEAAKIRVAYSGRKPIAAILTLTHKETVVYKYGCSDTAYHKSGAMHMLLWKTIEEAKRDGMHTLDLGRSHPASEGLIRFKSRWGSAFSVLSYSRFTSALAPEGTYEPSDRNWMEALRLELFRRMPTVLSCALGKTLYRHIG